MSCPPDEPQPAADVLTSTPAGQASPRGADTLTTPWSDAELRFPPDAETPQPSGQSGSVPHPRIERDGMAWPPAAWERPASAWRDDVWSGPGPFQPYDVAPSESPPQATGRSGGRLLREVLETGLLTLLIFLGIKLVVQNFKIQGASMEPTLHDGQFLLVNKLLYHGLGDPERGDIVVFKAWEQGGGEERDFIKRVIGVPDDTIEIRDGDVYVNNQVLDEPYLESDNLTTDRIGPLVLGSDDFYVMGDNRGNSSDSRTYGPLSRDRIIGKAWLSYWPLSDLGPIPDSVSSYAAGARD